MTGEKNYGVYIHIPFCKSKCNYCAFVSTPDLSLQEDYLNALIAEISNSPLKRGVCDTVYIGGGTPSCLHDGSLTRIFDALHRSFVVCKNAEITVECNPESVTDEFISECLSVGVNRISMGLQSSDDNVLRKIGRIHTFEKYMNSLKLLSKSFDNISTDLILGLPDQTEDDLKRALETVLPICSHVSVYALSIEEGTPLYKSGYTVDDDYVADLYAFAYNYLTAHGFLRYEVSNFARDGKQSKHNLKYWQNMPYFGFGVAAHGYDGNNTRYAHGNDIRKYISSPAPDSFKLSDKDRFNEYVMLSLRTERGICLKDFEKTFGYSLLKSSEGVINKLLKSGYIDLSEDFLRIKPEFMFVMNGIIEEIMQG